MAFIIVLLLCQCLLSKCETRKTENICHMFVHGCIMCLKLCLRVYYWTLEFCHMLVKMWSRQSTLCHFLQMFIFSILSQVKATHPCFHDNNKDGLPYDCDRPSEGLSHITHAFYIHLQTVYCMSMHSDILNQAQVIHSTLSHSDSFHEDSCVI